MVGAKKRVDRVTGNQQLFFLDLRSMSAQQQEMACRRLAPGHILNRCWWFFFFSGVKVQQRTLAWWVPNMPWQELNVTAGRPVGTGDCNQFVTAWRRHQQCVQQRGSLWQFSVSLPASDFWKDSYRTNRYDLYNYRVHITLKSHEI